MAVRIVECAVGWFTADGCTCTYSWMDQAAQFKYGLQLVTQSAGTCCITFTCTYIKKHKKLVLTFQSRFMGSKLALDFLPLPEDGEV